MVATALVLADRIPNGVTFATFARRRHFHEPGTKSMFTEKSSYGAAVVSAIMAVLSIFGAVYHHVEDLSVSRAAVQVAQAALQSEESWRKRPLVLFDVMPTAKPTLVNFGNGPALYLSVEVGGLDGVTEVSPTHLLPQQRAEIALPSEDRNGILVGDVTVTCSDVDGVRRVFVQQYWVERDGQGKEMWKFSEARRIPALGAEGRI